MFFRHVVGKVQLYPYLHIVTWGLPKRYLGLLRIFNLPLEEYPHQFIAQTSETFNSYELQVTKKSISSLQPNISTDEIVELGTGEGEKTIRNVELAQSASGNSSPPRKRGRRSKKKPVISIRVKLDDDLRNLKRTNGNGKNFDKILSRCSRRSCMLVIEKSNSDEYSLNFVSNTSYSKPFSKLLRKNRRKKEIWIDGSHSFRESKKSLASEFSEENIFPPVHENKNIFSETSKETKIPRNEVFNINSPEQPTPTKTSTYNSSNSKVEIKAEQKSNETYYEGKNIKTVEENKDRSIRNTQLAIPSHLIPYEEQVREERPLRNWPVLTKLFDEDHIEIYKNYLKSLSSQNKEDDEVEESEENINKDDGTVSIDIKEARGFHESFRSSPNIDKNHTTNNKLSKTLENMNIIEQEGTSSSPISSNPYTESSAKRNYFDKIKEDLKSNTTNLIEKSVVSTNYSIVSEKFPFVDNASQKLYTSTAYLLIGGKNDESKNEGKTSTFNIDKKKIANSSKSDSMVNTRLLSSSMKTYESITKKDDEESCYNSEENLAKTLTEINKNGCERKRRGMKKLYFFNIVLALFVTVVLGIILFISFADNSTINGVVERYIKR